MVIMCLSKACLFVCKFYKMSEVTLFVAIKLPLNIQFVQFKLLPKRMAENQLQETIAY